MIRSTAVALLAAFLIAIPLGNVVAQTQPSSPMSSAVETNAADSTILNSQIALSAGDVLSFRIVEDHSVAVRLTVTDTGEMEVPYVGRVTAANKTCRKLAEEIKAQLETDYYYRATVVLGIDSLRRPSTGRAYITGQVRTAGPLEFAEGEKLTVAEAVLKAGGFSDFADRRRVKVMRQTGKAGGVETLYVDVLAVWEKGKKEKDMEVKPGDQIFVASKLINF